MENHVINMSLKRQCKVTIIYQKKDSITLRNIIVKAIEGSRIKAYCYLRKQNRIFKLENVLAAEIKKERDGE